jgi:predicted Zn-ribbon and HTH transcriptional regulator
VEIVRIFQTQFEKDENKNSNNNISNETSYKQAIRFLICDSCFWCASCIRLDPPVRCPSCNCNKIEWMPIADGKIHKFDYDLTLDSTRILL